MEGLGDAVELVAKAMGIKPCGACGRRKIALNKAVPFKKREEPPKPRKNKKKKIIWLQSTRGKE